MCEDWTEWSDEEFLSYVSIHSETPRALFSANMVERLYEMAGLECIWGGPRPAFFPVHAPLANNLVQEAHKRIREQNRGIPLGAEENLRGPCE
jgi:hypothetical protein